jgi:hypothetical protein
VDEKEGTPIIIPFSNLKSAEKEQFSEWADSPRMRHLFTSFKDLDKYIVYNYGEEGMAERFKYVHMYAKGGEVANIDYNEILPILKEQIEDAIEILPNDFEFASEFKGEEVESKSRDGFIAYTDGGYEVRWFENNSYFTGAGYSLPTKSLQNELERQNQYNYDLAKERFVDEYPEIVEELGEENIDYNSLYEAGYESEAEELSEYEMDDDGTIMCEIGAYYYSPENGRGIEGEHTIRLFGLVNLESPYHRSGNLEDRFDVDITFNSIEELKEKLDLEISEIVNWFHGANYDDSSKELKIVRMAKGGQLKSKAKYIPNRDIDEIEVTRNGKTTSIDGANILDGVYVKKGTRFAKGGEVSEEEIIDKIQYFRNGIPPKGHKYALRFKGKVYSSNDTGDIVEKVMRDLKENKMAQGGRLSNAEMSKTNIKDWYKKNYKTDELGDEINPNITFDDVLVGILNGREIYSLIGVRDSVVRERLFSKLSKLNGRYENYANDLYRKYGDKN